MLTCSMGTTNMDRQNGPFFQQTSAAHKKLFLAAASFSTRPFFQGLQGRHQVFVVNGHIDLHDDIGAQGDG